MIITQDMIDAGNVALAEMTAMNKVGLGGEVVVAVFEAMINASVKGQKAEAVQGKPIPGEHGPQAVEVASVPGAKGVEKAKKAKSA